MILQGITPPLSASGAVFVSSFVKMDPANPYCVIQCTGPQDTPIGISQQGTFNAPGVFSTTNTLATQTGVSASNPTQIAVYGLGSVCRLQLSPLCNAVVPGQLLTSDQNGFGIDVANNNISGLENLWVGAMALTVGSAGQFIRVLVIAPEGFPNARIRVSLTPGVIAGATTSDQSFAVAGLPGSTTAAVVVSGEALTANIGIVNARILSAGSLQIRFINPTAASITPASQFFDIGFFG